MLGRAAEALGDADQAVSILPGASYALGTRCLIHYELGNRDKAKHDCAAALALEPQSLDTQGLLAYVNADPDHATKVWQESLAAHPENEYYLKPLLLRARR